MPSCFSLLVFHLGWVSHAFWLWDLLSSYSWRRHVRPASSLIPTMVLFFLVGLLSKFRTRIINLMLSFIWLILLTQVSRRMLINTQMPFCDVVIKVGPQDTETWAFASVWKLDSAFRDGLLFLYVLGVFLLSLLACLLTAGTKNCPIPFSQVSTAVSITYIFLLLLARQNSSWIS